MRRATASSLLLALALLVTSCGGGLTAEEYSAAVDSVCVDAAEFFRGLPARAAEEDLDTEAIEALAAEKAAESQATIEELDPPGELADEDARLLALGEEEPPEETDGEAVAYFEDFRDAYADIGAEECVSLQEDSIEQISDVLDDAPIP